MEDIDYFKLNSIDISNTFAVTFNLSTGTSSMLSISGYSIKIENVLAPLEGTFTSGTSSRTYPSAVEGSTLNYTITPVFNYDDVPIEYISKYTISGSLVVQTKLAQIYFSQYLQWYSCSQSVQGEKTINVVALVDTFGYFVDINGGIVTTPNGFVIDGGVVPEGFTKLANYTVDVDNKPILTQSSGNASVDTVFENFVVRSQSNDCLLANFSFVDYYKVPLTGGVITNPVTKSGDKLISSTNTFNLTNNPITVPKDTYWLQLATPFKIYPYSEDAINYCNSIVINEDFDKIILANPNIIITLGWDEFDNSFTMSALRYLYDAVETPSFNMDYVIQKVGTNISYTGTATFNYQSDPFPSELAELRSNLTHGTYNISLTLNEPTYQSPTDYFNGTPYFSKIITNGEQSISPEGFIFKNIYTFTDYEV